MKESGAVKHHEANPMTIWSHNLSQEFMDLDEKLIGTSSCVSLGSDFMNLEFSFKHPS